MNIETDRTFMRRLSVIDAEAFYKLNLDPEVLKFTGDKPFVNIGEAEAFLSSYDQYIKFGVGRLAVIEKATSRFIGWCGLKYHPGQNEYDVGFRFFREYWNRGFATETALHHLENGFVEMNIREIVGRAMKENTASIKVLHKLGMTYKSDFDFSGHSGVVYAITKVDFVHRFRN